MLHKLSSLKKYKWLLLGISLGLSSLLVGSLALGVPEAVNDNSTASVLQAVDLQFDEPVHLKIPKIEVDASIEPVGVTPLGAMDIPSGPAETAWFELGPRPGEIGSAVIAGHFGWKNGIPAAFDNLHKLESGDEIYVLDDKGASVTFIVRELKVYSENDRALEVFNSNDGESHLNLITCGGKWDKQKKSYSERLVVFTDKEV